jgi:hypothetical protein
MRRVPQQEHNRRISEGLRLAWKHRRKSMARRDASQAIRTCLVNHPDATTPQILALLQANGIHCSGSLVRSVRSRLKRNGVVERPQTHVIETPQPGDWVVPTFNAQIDIPVSHLFAVHAAAAKLGGTERLLECVAVLEQLRAA